MLLLGKGSEATDRYHKNANLFLIIQTFHSQSFRYCLIQFQSFVDILGHCLSSNGLGLILWSFDLTYYEHFRPNVYMPCDL